MMRMRRMVENKILMGLAGLGVLLILAVAGLAAVQLNASRKLARVRTDYKAIWMASNAYGMDNCGINYAVDTAERRKRDPSVPLTFEWDIEARKKAGNFGGIGLTTPVAYLKAIPIDPFKRGNQYYDYISCDSGPRSIRHLALVRSVGPDGKPDLPLDQLRETLNGYYRSLPKSSSWTALQAVEKRQLVRGQVDPYLYDPTNGSASRGDLVLVMNENHEHYGFAWEPDSPEWRNLPAANPPIRVESVRMAPAWKVGQPVPQSDNQVETKWMKAMVSLPPDLVSSFIQESVKNREIYTVLVRPGASTSTSLDDMETRQFQALLNRLRNHLGPFEAFFEHPGPLTAEMDQALEKWRAAIPGWWAGVCLPNASKAGNFSTPMRTYEAYDLLVLYGKSKLLYAGQLAAHGEGETALGHVAMLEGMLHYLAERMGMEMKDGAVSFPANPYLERIHRELGRLCAELRASIERQGAPVGAPASDATQGTGR